MPEDPVIRTEALDKRILDYILAVSDKSPWEDKVPQIGISWTSLFKDYRARYAARRSVAELYQDAKNDPFPLSSNLGTGIEQITGEALIPRFLANTFDLDPMCQAMNIGTDQKDDALTTFHDRYRRREVPMLRDRLEESNREMLTVGSVFHKWTYGSNWKQTEGSMTVFVDPATGQPLMTANPQTGEPEPLLVDPNLPEEVYPKDALGRPYKVSKVPTAQLTLRREGPMLAIRPADTLRYPKSATVTDPDEWDWMTEDFQVSPWWFLGRDGDPFEGKLQNIDKLFTALKIDRNKLYEKPTDTLSQQIKCREFYGKYPAAQSGKPVEIIGLVALEHNILLGWRLSPFPRRPYFNRKVMTRGRHPIGMGIPETVWALRSAMDALLNQDIDAGNLYNHPPLLLSQYAMLDDEDYEQMGLGTRWIMGDINGAKFLPPPVAKRDPIAMLEWLMSQVQRLWGVTDFALNAPSRSLSPNISTATGASIVQSEANVKFSHLIRHLSASDSDEMQFCHELFYRMLANPKLVSVEGKATKVTRTFFNPDVRVSAVGDGMSTNPAIRQQANSAFYQMMVASQNPHIADPETLFQLTKQLASDYAVKVPIKEPQALQQVQLIQQVMQTEPGQRHMQQAIQEIQVLSQIQQAQQQQQSGRPNVAVQSPNPGI